MSPKLLKSAANRGKAPLDRSGFSFNNPDDELPMMERAYWAVIKLLYNTGLQGVSDVKTARIADLAGTTESTLLRHAKTRDGLVGQTIDWCWKVVNERLANAAYSSPLVDSDPAKIILQDMENFLTLFEDERDRVWATGALLGYRRSQALVGDVEQVELQKFLGRLENLCHRLMRSEDVNEREDQLLAAFLLNSVATAWFTWLLKPESLTGESLITKRFVLAGAQGYLEEYSRYPSAV